MHIKKWGYEFDLPDEWIKEAEFSPFGIEGEYYRSLNNKDVFIVDIGDICPQIRAKEVPIFNDGEVDGVYKTARERTVSILKALAEVKTLPPIEVIKEKNCEEYKYKIIHGAHRLHCSIAAGFKKIPAVWGFDINR